MRVQDGNHSHSIMGRAMKIAGPRKREIQHHPAFRQRRYSIFVDRRVMFQAPAKQDFENRTVGIEPPKGSFKVRHHKRFSR